MLSNALGIRDSIDDIGQNGVNAENTVDLAGSAAGLGSSSNATTGLAGWGLNALGAGGAGETMVGAARAAGPVGALPGSFVGGVALGRGTNHVAAENNYFGDHRSVSNWLADIADDIRKSGHPILGGLSIPFTSLGGTAYTGVRWAGGKLADGAVKDGASWLGGKAVDAGAAAWNAGCRAVNYAKDNMTLTQTKLIGAEPSTLLIGESLHGSSSAGSRQAVNGGVAPQTMIY